MLVEKRSKDRTIQVSLDRTMAKITKTKYKKDLKDRVKAKMVSEYIPGAPNKSLRYWVNYNKNEKKDFDDWLVEQGIEVVEDEQ